MKTSNSMNYFWFGFGAGVAAAAILTPKSGADTRNYLHTHAVKTGESLKHQTQDLVELASKTLDQGKEGYQHQLRKFSAVVNAGRKAYARAS